MSPQSQSQLIIYVGKNGCGKTHRLQKIANGFTNAAFIDSSRLHNTFMLKYIKNRCWSMDLALRMDLEKVMLDVYGLDLSQISSDENLSNGQKFLICLLGQVIDYQESEILCIDNPETGLHVDVQRSLITVIRKLAPSSKIYIATHSPSICSQWREYIVNLSKKKSPKQGSDN